MVLYNLSFPEVPKRPVKCPPAEKPTKIIFLNLDDNILIEDKP